MAEQAVVLAPAKINLTLDITGRRPDGYHTMQMVMQAVDLCDRVTITRRPQPGILLRCSRPDLPQGPGNLAWRAAERFLAQVGRPGDGLEIVLEKRIPSQAGLAGGSADGAGVLRGLNALYGSPLSEEALCALALPLGADVPFCLVGGTVLAQGIGEAFTPLPALPACHIVIAKPQVGVSTAAAFARFDREGCRRRPDTPGMVAALRAGSLPQVGQALCNVLEETAALPEVAALRRQMEQSGALGSAMTGSGSAVFALFAGEEPARRCCEGLRAAAPEVFLTRPLGRGAYLAGRE